MAQPYGGDAPALVPAPTSGPIPAHPPITWNLNTLLGMAALVISILALVVSLTIPGPTGPAGATGTGGATGPQGPQGPAGPGSLMAANSTSQVVAMESTCTNYEGAALTIAIPRAGRIEVSADVMLEIGHTAGTRDNAWTMISNDTSTCTIDPSMAIFLVPDSLATGSYWGTVPMMKNYTVAAPGSYTFYINGLMQSGQSTGDDFFFGYLAAVFYPG